MRLDEYKYSLVNQLGDDKAALYQGNNVWSGLWSIF